MKIAIITQPLHTNYGGLLQAFALQKVLKDEGHEAWMVNRYYNQGAFYRFLSSLKNSILDIFLKHSFRKILHIKDELTTALSFKKHYITPCSGCLSSDKALKSFCQKHHFDVYIVGSDQVWRPEYAPNIYNYFFNFVDSKEPILISYAASFGTSEWNFSKEQTEKCRYLLKRFSFVSVREKSGIDLCQKYFGRDDAVHVLDPTMLLPKSEYIKIVDKANYPKPKKKFIVSYILDPSSEKERFLSRLSHMMNMRIYDARKGLDCNKHLHIKQMATVEEWLYGFRYADYAIIDSFHGCVFSILFHIPFVVIGNKKRGMDRFYSLLSMFELEDRLVYEDNLNVDILKNSIDWKRVDTILDSMKNTSMEFLNRFANIDNKKVNF